jgi:hypothetical protein
MSEGTACEMTLEGFYEEMKEALRYFGVPWGQMDRVKVRFTSASVIFVFEDREIRIKGQAA